MAITRPGSGPNLVADAHYHAIKATKTWADFVAAMGRVIANSEAARERAERQRVRETTYARGILGRH